MLCVGYDQQTAEEIALCEQLYYSVKDKLLFDRVVLSARLSIFNLWTGVISYVYDDHN